MTEDMMYWLIERPWGERLLRFIPRWAFVGWWTYLLGGLGDLPWFSPWFMETKAGRVWCRLRRHPNGEVYWNPGGDEPNHDCVDCGEDIG